LTKGEHGVTDVWAAKGYTEEDILHLTASLEQNSEHIVGKGIVNEAQKNNTSILDKVARLHRVCLDLGVQGHSARTRQCMLRPATAISEEKQAQLFLADIEPRWSKQAAKEGKTEVYLITDGKVVVGALGSC
jgi:cation transport ATPase